MKWAWVAECCQRSDEARLGLVTKWKKGEKAVVVGFAFIHLEIKTRSQYSNESLSEGRHFPQLPRAGGIAHSHPHPHFQAQRGHSSSVPPPDPQREEWVVGGGSISTPSGNRRGAGYNFPYHCLKKMRGQPMLNDQKKKKPFSLKIKCQI